MDKINLTDKRTPRQERSFTFRNYQGTAGNVVIAIASPVVVDIRQPAIVAIAAIKTVGVLKICFNSPKITGDLFQEYLA